MQHEEGGLRRTSIKEESFYLLNHYIDFDLVIQIKAGKRPLHISNNALYIQTYAVAATAPTSTTNGRQTSILLHLY